MKEIYVKIKLNQRDIYKNWIEIKTITCDTDM